MSRVLDDIGEKYPGKIRVEKIDLMQNRDVARKYNVRYVPHLLFVDANDVVLKENVGGMSLDDVVKTFREIGIALE